MIKYAKVYMISPPKLYSIRFPHSSTKLISYCEYDNTRCILPMRRRDKFDEKKECEKRKKQTRDLIDLTYVLLVR